MSLKYNISTEKWVYENLEIKLKDYYKNQTTFGWFFIAWRKLWKHFIGKLLQT